MIGPNSDFKVSVIIPTYKRNDFLDRAINSVLNQTHSNIEIIVVDDNDPNSSYRESNQHLIEKYGSVIYVENEKNIGSALSRNRGISKATGDFITFLDDDDVYLPDKVRLQLEFMIQENLDMSFTDLKLHNEQDKLIDFRSYDHIKKFDKETLMKMHLTKHITGTDTFMYKRVQLNKIGGFDPIDMGDEFYLMYKSIEKGLKIGYLNKAEVIAYVHSREGLSKGSKKVEGEKELYEFKKQNFKALSKEEQKFIHFRHLAVLMITYMREKKMGLTLYYTLLCFFSSPKDFINEVFQRLQKKNA